MHKLDIVCPFCLENTKRWKRFDLIWIKYPVVIYDKHGVILAQLERRTQGVRYESEAVKFEQKVLQEHLTTCTMRDKVSRVVLEHYNLV